MARTSTLFTKAREILANGDTLIQKSNGLLRHARRKSINDVLNQSNRIAVAMTERNGGTMTPQAFHVRQIGAEYAKNIADRLTDQGYDVYDRNGNVKRAYKDRQVPQSVYATPQRKIAVRGSVNG